MDQLSQEQPPPVGRRNPQPDAAAPDGSEVRLLVDHRHGAARASLCEVTLLAGQVSRPVWHRRVEEIWYVLEGHGQIWRCPPGAGPDAMATVPVGPGDALTIPPGWRFQFSAGRGGLLRFLCYTSPLWPGPNEAQPAEHGGLGEATA
ncbi:MAG: cupin domain-containing protein [Dehalococcoidia bacterium]|nr:cupin domain-containing protein [Dehalococcoidia bacterium]MDP7084075.1 cupin domain-containing protein [Dehalococcoidia bacterium]MDP7200812.1 cupin domain-containing protein [Dehalococcoidia bacterium]MDP7511130.1 cupin domain-containing protein [Dehalococcoidia bacterium]